MKNQATAFTEHLMGNTKIITLSGIVFYDILWNWFNREKENN